MNAVVLANNLTLVISGLWCLVNTLIFLIPLMYALGSSGTTYDAERNVKGQGSGHSRREGMAFWSYAALLITLISAFLIAAACLGLGQGFTDTGVSVFAV